MGEHEGVRGYLDFDAGPILAQLQDKKRRATALSPPERYLLERWAESIDHAFREVPYLVGSCARAEVWRDIDVRLILDDDDPILADRGRVEVLNVAVSLWGQRATGLPIDFQFQSMSEANGGENEGPRMPLGLQRRLREAAPAASSPSPVVPEGDPKR